MSYRIAFNTNGGAAMADVTAEANDWADVPAAEPGEFLSGRTFDGWIVTGHDRKTAVYSADGGVTETALDSDPAVVVHDGAIAVKNLAADGGLVQLSARWRVRFGGLNAGCQSVWVAPFTPICSKGGVGGSTPLTLDVPAPVFAPYIPPPECACFLFDSSKTANVNVTMSPGNTMKAKGTAKVAISSVGDCCDGKYEVTPTITIDIPECVTEDKEYENTVPIGPSGNGAITYRWGIRNCVPFFEMSAEPLEFPDIVVPGFCLDEPTFTLTGTYKFPNDKKATQVLTKNIKLKFGNSADNPGCHTYTPGNIELDLTNLAFGNNGDVYKDGNTGNLIVGGILDSNDGVQWWYGGGTGDYGDDSRVGQYVYQRGPTMRGVEDETDPPTHFPLVYDEPEYKLMDDPGHTPNTRWRSENKDETDPFGNPETEGEEWATGNLDMVLPSGFQWDSKEVTRGVSVVMSEFAWNPGGLLCAEVEKAWAPVLAPGIAVWADNTEINYNNGSTPVSIDVSGMNASGIAVMKSPEDTRQQPGLIIYDGDGLRVFGADGKTVDTEITSTTKAKMGRLEVYAHDGDFKFNYDGKMVLNDEAALPADTIIVPLAGIVEVNNTAKAYLLAGTQTQTDDDEAVTTPQPFIRDTEARMSVVVALGVTGPSGYWERVTNNGLLQVKTSMIDEKLSGVATALSGVPGTITKDNCPNAVGYIKAALVYLRDAVNIMNNAMGTLGIANVNVARSGVITNISGPINNNIPRRYMEEPPASQGS